MIRMSEQKDLSGDKATSGGGFNINPIDIVMYLLSNWYWYTVCQFVRRIRMVSICQTSLYLFTVGHRHDKGRLFKQHRPRAGPF